jgi:hypothetical protein
MAWESIVKLTNRNQLLDFLREVSGPPDICFIPPCTIAKPNANSFESPDYGRDLPDHLGVDPIPQLPRNGGLVRIRVNRKQSVF